jgi:hypothetical protein
MQNNNRAKHIHLEIFVYLKFEFYVPNVSYVTHKKSCFDNFFIEYQRLSTETKGLRIIFTLSCVQGLKISYCNTIIAVSYLTSLLYLILRKTKVSIHHSIIINNKFDER